MEAWNLHEYIEEQMDDSSFRRAWQDGEGEYQAQRALIEARAASGMSQRELSCASGVPQKTISLIETAGTNTTVETLGKLAHGMGKILSIHFDDPVVAEGQEFLEG